MTVTITPQQRADTCARVIMEKDAASRSLGIEVAAVAPGSAELTMTVTRTMLNGHGSCHGAFIFALADSAFAVACNSYNETVVAQQNQFTYLEPGAGGDKLKAVAGEVSKRGRSGIYDVTVTRQGGGTVALFRGLARVIKGQHFDEVHDSLWRT